MNHKAQGALEYLLLIGGAVLVAGIVLVLMLGVSGSGGKSAGSTVSSIQISELMAANGVGYWQLNGNANDSSGKGNNATLVGNVTFVTDPTRGTVASFDGAQGTYLNLPSGVVQSNNFTFAAWIKPTSDNGGGCGTNSIFNAYNPTVFGVWNEGGNLNFSVSNASGSGSSLAYTFPYGTVLWGSLLNKWSHVAAVRSGNTLTLYLNGVKLSTHDFTPSPDNGLADMSSVTGGTLGHFLCGNAAAYQGYLSKVLMSNRALSDSEIAGLANS